MTFATSFTCECSLIYACRAENVGAYLETPRISFYIAVTNPKNLTEYIPKSDVEDAIR